MANRVMRMPKTPGARLVVEVSRRLQNPGASHEADRRCVARFNGIQILGAVGRFQRETFVRTAR